MGVQIFFRNLQSNQRAAHWRLCEFEHSTQQLCALAHRYPANSVLSFLRREAAAVILDFELKIRGQKFQPHPSLRSPGMAGNIIDGFLHDAIEMNGSIAIDRKRRSA